MVVFVKFLVANHSVFVRLKLLVVIVNMVHSIHVLLHLVRTVVPVYHAIKHFHVYVLEEQPEHNVKLKVKILISFHSHKFTEHYFKMEKEISLQ
jgi:hypothetical protein